MRYNSTVPTFRHIRLSPIAFLALFSVLGFLGVAAAQTFHLFDKEPAPTFVATNTADGSALPDATWQQEMMLLGLATSSDPGLADGEDPLALITPSVLAQIVGEYNGLQMTGEYSAAAAEAAAARIAPNVYANVTYKRYETADIKTDPDASYARMLAYRADLQTALQPLLLNTRAEYEIYGSYVATGDASHLRTLEGVAKNYADAAAAAAKLTVPTDIALTHVTLLNALIQFSATLESMVAYAEDPIASMALLRTYNDAEYAVVSSFDKLAQYARLKQP